MKCKTTGGSQPVDTARPQWGQDVERALDMVAVSMEGAAAASPPASPPPETAAATEEMEAEMVHTIAVLERD